MISRVAKFGRFVNSAGEQDDSAIPGPTEFLADAGFGVANVTPKTRSIESAVERSFGDSPKCRSIETVFGDDLPRSTGDVRCITRNQPFADLCSKATAHSDAIVVPDLVRRVVNVSDPDLGSRVTTHQEVPSAGVVLVIVNRVVLFLSKKPAKFSAKT